MTDSTNLHPLVRRLYDLAQHGDRCALANLRRSLSEGSRAQAYPYVAPFFGEMSTRRYEDALLTTAGLFALHPSPGSMSLARALRGVQARSGSESIEGRFVALLNAHPDDVGDHIRHAVSLTRSFDLGIDWNDLLWSLVRWDEERTRRKWARDFWSVDDSGSRDDFQQENGT